MLSVIYSLSGGGKKAMEPPAIASSADSKCGYKGRQELGHTPAGICFPPSKRRLCADMLEPSRGEDS
jgi:hypothetical protein